LLLVALLPAAILNVLMTKEYVVGLTDRRLIVLRFTGKLVVKDSFVYDLALLDRVATKAGSVFTWISIDNKERPFRALFHRSGLADNQAQSRAIAAAVARPLAA